MIINILLFLLVLMISSLLHDIFILKLTLIPLFILLITLKKDNMHKSNYIFLIIAGLIFDICFTHILLLNSILFICIYEFINKLFDKTNIFLLNTYALIIYLILYYFILFIFAHFNENYIVIISTFVQALFINTILLFILFIIDKIRKHRI